MDNESLKHHGVRGMRWGVRRTQAQLGRGEKSPGSEDYERSRAINKKGSKNLSTKELQELNQRLQLERQYSNLNPNSYQKGMDFVKKVTATGTTIAGLYALTKTPLGQSVITTVRAAVDNGLTRRAYRKAMGG